MGVVDKEDVVAIRRDNGEIVCMECATEEDWETAQEENFITGQEMEKEEKIYFCDECKEKIV